MITVIICYMSFGSGTRERLDRGVVVAAGASCGRCDGRAGRVGAAGHVPEPRARRAGASRARRQCTLAPLRLPETRPLPHAGHAQCTRGYLIYIILSCFIKSADLKMRVRIRHVPMSLSNT